MTTAVLELNVSGMICRACEDAIADALLHTRGVISAQAHYWRSRVTITYDPDIVTEDALRQVLTNAGYPPGAHGMGGVVVDLICLALVGVLYWGLPKLLPPVQVPALAEHASLGLVFLV
ncbi:MAG: heavy-metal-associated domain-containing protein, partial [Oscillospiraceae bacterium]